MKIRFPFVIFFILMSLRAEAQETAPLKKKHLVVNYYPNGKIKEKGYQGYYENKEISTGMYIGTWRYYNENGRLVQSIYYQNDVPAKAYIEKTNYHPNGKVSSVERFNNYELYQSEVDSIGTWKYYDSTGKLIRKTVH